ncbi:hypothetical protein GCM10025868_11460 [Angustibacter aerolatus]|uniref:Uncharacterized protein n=1 Tax=Angustibacter aerolatus TaxID=1162965 RepID=A0ABQ6JGI9_9ACTN|nr:hypothetical protein GCM10025868_11460 [Angustibacter aerolatus]
MRRLGQHVVPGGAGRLHAVERDVVVPRRLGGDLHPGGEQRVERADRALDHHDAAGERVDRAGERGQRVGVARPADQADAHAVAVGQQGRQRVDRGGGHEQRPDRVGVRTCAQRPVPLDRHRQRCVARREHGGVVHETGEQR